MKCQIVLGQGAKHNLVLDSPLITGSNAISINERTVAPFGAVLTPMLSHHEMLTTQPGFARTNSGYLLSPGYGWLPWQRAKRLYRSVNPQIAKPVIAAVSPEDAREAFNLAQALGSWEQIKGIALNLQDDHKPDDLLLIIQAINRATDLPLLVRLPFRDPTSYNRICDTGSVAAVIVTAPPPGEVLQEGAYQRGDLHSPALVPLIAAIIHQLQSQTELPMIARADAGSVQDVLTLTAAGAEAVILEGALWVEPNIAEDIRRGLDDRAQRWQVETWQAFSQRLRQDQFSPLPDQNA